MLESHMAAALEELKRQIGELGAEVENVEWIRNASDHTLQRFLRGHKWNEAVAIKKLQACAKWRKEYGTDQITETWPKNQSKEALLLRQFWPMSACGRDLEGRPVHFFDFAAVDFPGLLKQVSMENLVRHNVYLAERAYENFPNGDAVMLINFPHFNVAEVGKSLKSITSFIRAMAKVADPYYPESYARIYLVSGFSSIFLFVGLFVPFAIRSLLFG
jgi:hypothetical protein